MYADTSVGTVDVPLRSRGSDSWHRLLADRWATGGGLLVALLGLVAALAPVLDGLGTLPA